jgi:hypothetical protein
MMHYARYPITIVNSIPLALLSRMLEPIDLLSIVLLSVTDSMADSPSPPRNEQ